MITEVIVKNYRSIIDANVKLSPFTLLIGANGAGKSNFLKLLKEGTDASSRHYEVVELQTGLTKHKNFPNERQQIAFRFHDKLKSKSRPRKEYLQIYSIDSTAIGKSENLVSRPIVQTDGSGAISVLDTLKTGDREDLFDKIEATLARYVPEIEKLSFIPGPNTKQLQVREKYIKEPIPLKELSDGTRLVLTILTIIYQDNPPDVICLEEIDRALHPRLFQRIIELCFDITEQTGTQIIATTHNPYLLDQFKDREESVIIVEKENGGTKFTPLLDRLALLESEDDLMEEDNPLGELWYSGLLGGIPRRGSIAV